MTEPLLLVSAVTRTRGSTPTPARAVYDSQLWRLRRRHAERRGLQWLVVSPCHGLIEPDQVIEPRERSLASLGAADADHLARVVVEGLEERCGTLNGREVELHASDRVAGPLASALASKGAVVTRPVPGRSTCAQIQWYRQQHGEAHHLEDACPVE